MTLDLSDAGAQNGSLTFYSKKTLKAGASDNCKIDSIKDLGENIWQVKLTDRLWGKAQSLEMKIGK